MSLQDIIQDNSFEKSKQNSRGSMNANSTHEYCKSSMDASTFLPFCFAYVVGTSDRDACLSHVNYLCALV
jgi:hypothetical protein